MTVIGSKHAERARVEFAHVVEGHAALLAGTTRPAVGWRDAIEAAAKALETANVSPPEAKGHWANAADVLRLYTDDGRPLAPPKPEPGR